MRKIGELNLDEIKRVIGDLVLTAESQRLRMEEMERQLPLNGSSRPRDLDLPELVLENADG